MLISFSWILIMFTSLRPKTLTLITALIFSINAHAAPSENLKKKMASLGTIKEFKETESKGVYAWFLEKNGKTLVLYSTPDEKHFIKGTIYNVDNKKIISDKYAIDSLKYASDEFRNKVLSTKGNFTTTNPKPGEIKLTKSEEMAFEKGYMNIKWDKPQIPEALKLIDSLAGAKEGKGKPQDTLYIIYDPRCPWCHRTFEATREYVAKGYSIKWIPTLALGKKTDAALSLAAAPLQNINLLTASFEKKDNAKKIQATQKNKDDIEQNFQFLLAYFKKVKPSENPAVPIGIFLDKTSGKVTDIQGLQEREILELLFGNSK